MSTSNRDLDALRRMAWKGELRGITRIMEELDDPMRELITTWEQLQTSFVNYQDDRNADNREALQADLNVFDDALSQVFGPSEPEQAASK